MKINYTADKVKIIIENNLNIINFNYHNNELENIIAEKNKIIILDLQKVKSIDCTGLDIILNLYYNLKRKNSKLKIKNISSPYLKKFIALTNLNEIIEII